MSVNWMCRDDNTKCKFFSYVCRCWRRCRQMQAETVNNNKRRARACVCLWMCCIFCMCCVTVCARLDHFCWFCSQSQHLRMSGEVGGRLFDWRFLQLHNQCVRVRARNASPSTSLSAAATAAADCARVIYMCGCIDEQMCDSLCVWVCVGGMRRRVLSKWKWHKYL